MVQQELTLSREVSRLGSSLQRTFKQKAPPSLNMDLVAQQTYPFAFPLVTPVSNRGVGDFRVQGTPMGEPGERAEETGMNPLFTPANAPQISPISLVSSTPAGPPRLLGPFGSP